ncbi:hypothetical protein [Streptomyces griseofuscus]|uniref:hypothetical protein n=1 Tax=Streptomyces griseofuscus TaxID=146922 RepID=UPI00342EFC6C
MARQGAVRRGTRFGVRVGVIPAVFWGILFLFAAVAPFGSGPLAVLRPGLIAVVGSLTGVLFQAEVAVVAVVTDDGYGPTLAAFLATPAVAALAAAHSGDIAGRSRRHPWRMLRMMW